MKIAKQEISEAYLKAYIDNEADANRKMSYANAIASGVALILWICYLVDFFTVPRVMFPVVAVLFPVAALLLIIPLFFLKSKKIREPWFKYFLLFSFLLVVAAINVTIPKHGVLGWALAIVMANHYYNPKFALKIFIVTLVGMLLCLYLGMFFGEYDPLLLGLGVVVDGKPNTVNTPEERLALINELMAQGNNRYIKVFTMYYIPRAGVISLLFVISNSLNRRTSKLLQEEIKIHGEQEKDKAELNVAKDIQLSTLPTEELEDGNTEVLGELNAAKEVGGDLYDYLDIDENHVAILIGDASGKGIPAAMFMMKTITSFRDFATAGKSPAEILGDINASIHKGNKATMFVTVFLAILDKRDGKFVYANAGHNHPIIGNGKDYSYLQCNNGFLLGCFPKVMVKNEELILKPGDTITLYTDGITEARNLNGDFFGEERFLNVFKSKEHSSLSELHEDIKAQIRAYAGEAGQSDDITLLTLKYFG